MSEDDLTKMLADLVALGEKHPRSWPAADDLPPALVKAGEA